MRGVEKMKKIITVAVVIMLMFTLTGCGKKEEQSVSDLLAKIDKKIDKEVLDKLTRNRLDDGIVANYLGTDEFPIVEGIAEESDDNKNYYSVILVRIEEDLDVDWFMAEVKESISSANTKNAETETTEEIEGENNTEETVTEDRDIVIKNKDNLVIIISIKDKKNRKIIEEAFDNL